MRDPNKLPNILLLAGKPPNINEMAAKKCYPTPHRAIYRIRSHQADVLSMMHDKQLLPSDIEKR